MKKFISIIIFGFIFSVFCVSASAQTLTVTGDYANCRRYANKNSEYWGRVYKGEQYEILGSDYAPNGIKWYRIQQKSGKGGYICGSFVRLNGTTKSSSREFLGKYKITGYCAACNSPRNSYATASGRRAEVGRTIAMKGVPLGTKIYIDGIGERIVDDRCGSSGVCDVFCARHGDESGITGYRNVYIVR